MAAELSLRLRDAVSKEAVQERLTDGFVALVRIVTTLGMAGIYRREGLTRRGVFAAFKRVIVRDSTVVALPPHLAHAFPGPRNQSGKVQAAMKLQTSFELKSDCFLSVTINAFTRNDQAASPDILTQLLPGDLLLQDLGYFVLDVFRRIADQGAYFLSRLHPTTDVLDPTTGKAINLLQRLRQANTLDLDVWLGQSERLPVRLVARRVPAGVAEERRRKARQNRDKRTKPSPDRLALLDWELFVTNVPRDVWSSDTVAQVYGFRWRIEILFKIWKSFLHLTCLPQKSSAQQVTCLALARIMHAVHFHSDTWHLVRYTLLSRGKHASLVKTAMLFTGPSGARLRHVIRHHPDAAADVLAQHCAYEKRRRISYADAYEYYTDLDRDPMDKPSLPLPSARPLAAGMHRLLP